MLQNYTLSNGIKVATYSMESLRSIHLRINVKGGSILEKKGKSGTAHFLEHMLIQGIPSLPNAEILSDYIEGLAGSYNASTGEFTINFVITVPVTHLEMAVKIASEIFFEPLIPESSLEKERRAIIEEVKQRMDSQDYKLGKFVREQRFVKGSVLARPVGGLVEDVEQLTKEDLVEFWESIFVPNNTYISITGNFSEVRLEKLLNQYMGRYKRKKSFAMLPTFTKKELSSKKVKIRYDGKLKTNYFDLSFPTLTLENDLVLRLRQSMLLAILVNLSRSRMFRLLRYQKGLVYGISGGSYTINGLGYTAIASEAAKENIDEVISLVIQELSNFAQTGPTEEELAVTKEFLSNQWLMSFDHPSSIANWIEGDLIWENRIFLPEHMIELIKKTTVKDLVELMQNHWDFSRVNLVIQGATKNTKLNCDKYKELLSRLK